MGSRGRRCIACAGICPDEHRETGGLWDPVPTGGYSRSDTIRWEDCPPQQRGRAGWEKSLVQVSTQGRQDLALPGAIFGQKSSRKPSPREQRSKRHSKQRKQARCQGQRSPGVRGHCFCRRQPRQKKSQYSGRLAKPSSDPTMESRLLLTSSHCWTWCWPHRQCPGNRAAGHSFQGHPPLPPASRGGQRSGPARASRKAAGTDTTQ